MGKLRRERQKYHLSKVKSLNNASATTTENYDTSIKQPPETLAVLSVPENPFAGIDISDDKLKQSLKDSDVRSVISKKSLCAGSVISKKEKKKLRHEAFLRKLEAAYQQRQKDGKKQKKLKRGLPKAETQAQSDKFQFLGLSDKLPSLDLSTALAEKNSDSKRKPVTKQRGISKAKYRNKVMLKDVSLFKSLLKNVEFKADPITSISNHVHSKVHEELMKDS